MAVADTPSDVITLKVVYYGPPGAGKTTNLERISTLINGTTSGRITPRQLGENRIASLEIPLGSLGRVMGSSVVVRLETMQGEVSSAGWGWSQMLADADGIVFVADSLHHARTANVKSLAGIRERLEARGRSAAAIPVLMQWNKRDHADARPIAEMETELNHRCFPTIEAASLRGMGVTETLTEILRRTISAAHRKAGGTALVEAELGESVTAAIQQLLQAAREASTERFGMTIDRQSSAWTDVRESPRLHRDSESVWSREVVYSAESIAQEPSAAASRVAEDRARSDAATRMLEALQRVTLLLEDQNLSGLPRGLMAGLLAGCDRTHGSLLLFRQGTSRMEECEIVPAGRDPLNARQSSAAGTEAAFLCSGHEPQFIEDLNDETSLGGDAPRRVGIRSALIVPLVFGSLSFGGMLVYVMESEHAPTTAEHAYWRTAASLSGVHLAWQAGKNRAVVSRRTERRPDLTTDRT